MTKKLTDFFKYLYSHFAYEGPYNDGISMEIPHYDKAMECWKVVVDGREEAGSVNYVASEFAKCGLIYPFHMDEKSEEEYHEHEHSFEEVIADLLLDEHAEFFSIEGFEEYYSPQEIKMLTQIKKRIMEIKETEKR
jgi:hypothetical protein